MLKNTTVTLRKKNTESVKQIKIITQQPFENRNILDIK